MDHQETLPISQETFQMLVKGPNLRLVTDAPDRLKIKQPKISHIKQLRQDSSECFYCTAPLSKETATVDHVVPKSLGGGNNVNNLVVSCKSCNLLKANNRSFILLRWKKEEPCFDVKTTIKLCTAKEKLDLYQTILGYLLLDQEHRAHRVMKAYLNAHGFNSKVNIDFAGHIKGFSTGNKKNRSRVISRIVTVIQNSQAIVNEIEKNTDAFDYQYLIEGEIYSDIPYFNILAMDD